MNVCVIPARVGSKRIPKKNIKDFLGQPIIAYSIQAACQSCLFDHVIVSTDSEEIKSIALEYGAEVPFLRPKELSCDQTGTIPVLVHAIEWVIENTSVTPDFLCCLYPTAPFVTSEIIQKSFKRLTESHSDYCVTVTEYAYPIQRALIKDQSQQLKMMHAEHRSTRSQDLQKTYHDAGQLYWGKVSSFLNGVPLFDGNTVPFTLPGHFVQDIDTPEDWEMAKLLFQAFHKMDKDL